VPSARAFSVSETPLLIGTQDLHLWLCPHHGVADSDHFKRQLLSHYARVAPADWRFSRGEHGKPGLLDSPRPLDFNLSHSAGWLACAVTAGTVVGLDIEYCDPDRDVLKLAGRFFQAYEIEDLQACNKEEQTARFYDYWTLKESSIKARGEALGQGLESVGFRLDLPAGTGGVTGLRESRGDPDNLTIPAYYCLLEPIVDYRLAVCWLRPTTGLPHLRMFELRGAGQPAKEFSKPLRAASITH